MGAMTVDKAKVNLKEIRDKLITDAQRLESLDENSLQVYSNGVLDMYNSFVLLLMVKPEDKSDITYEV